jgi:hypothetical protein
MGESKHKELTPVMKKADRLFRISATRVKSLAGDGKTLIIEHRFGQDGGSFSAEEAMARLGFRDEFIKEDGELEAYYKVKLKSPEVYKEKRDRALTHYLGKSRSALENLIDYLDEFYEPQGGLVRAAWLPTFDGNGKKTGSRFFLQAMIDRNSRKIVVGEDGDYAKYLWAIKKATQRAHDKNEEITADTREYLRMGHAGKDVVHFLNTVLKQDIGTVPLLSLHTGESK